MGTATVRYAAPGRINLIGEHTDYNLGFALPIALPNRTIATYVPDDTDTITARSDREAGQVVIPLDTTPGDVTGWAAYVAGVVWALRDTGQPVRGGTVSITSDVEMGSGLASSAALECAVLGAPVPEPRSIGSSRPGSHSAPRMNMSVPQWVCWINSPRCSANHNGRY
jgi:galactokinase